MAVFADEATGQHLPGDGDGHIALVDVHAVGFERGVDVRPIIEDEHAPACL